MEENPEDLLKVNSTAILKNKEKEAGISSGTSGLDSKEEHKLIDKTMESSTNNLKDLNNNIRLR